MNNPVKKNLLAELAKKRGIDPQSLFALGADHGEYVDIDPKVLGNRLATPRHVKPPTMNAADEYAEPTVAELAGNFSGAVARWVSAGAPVVSRLTYEVRAATCAACPQWDGAARFGLGRCRAPGCGCTSLKRWLATEKCPLGKWPERSDL